MPTRERYNQKIIHQLKKQIRAGRCAEKKHAETQRGGGE